MKRIVKLITLGLLGLIVLTLVGGLAFQRIATASAFKKHQPLGRMVDVDGVNMHIHCTGSGDGPTVVLESGFGGWAIDWNVVQPDIAKIARVSSYDRAGLGWSERGPKDPAIRGEIAQRLHTLLRNAGVPGPYVLVAHSLGGLYTREFARIYPKDVAGLVFLDSSHEEMGARASAKDRQDNLKQLRTLKMARYLMPFGVQRLVNQPVANASSLPETDQPAAYGIGFRSSSYFALYDEMAGLLEEGFDKRMTLEPIPEVPIYVLTAEENLEGERGDFWKELQKELADLSPDSEHEIVEGSSHFIQVDHPERVVEAIRSVIERAS